MTRDGYSGQFEKIPGLSVKVFLRFDVVDGVVLNVGGDDCGDDDPVL